MKSIPEIREAIKNHEARSAWNKGVKLYALELLDDLTETLNYNPNALDNANLLKKALLNGADSWTQYSEGGCSLCCDCDIAERLCNPTELKRSHGGERNPNSRESWLDTQARALGQAARWIINAAR